MEQLQTLRDQLGGKHGDAGRIASGPTEADDETLLHGIGTDREDDGYRLRSGHSGADRGRLRECVNPECKLIVWKSMSGREFEREEVAKLLTTGQVGPLEGFRSKLGRAFNAEIILSEKTEWKQKFDFEDQGDGESAGQGESEGGQEV